MLIRLAAVFACVAVLTWVLLAPEPGVSPDPKTDDAQRAAVAQTSQTPVQQAVAVDAAPALPKVTRQDSADEACADCHPEQAEGFYASGMGRSMYLAKGAKVVENFQGEAARVVHAPSGLIYEAYIGPEGRWWQRESLPDSDYERVVEAVYIIGSGNHTRSYMGWVEGELIELPLTWYVRKKIWDMSPGYIENNHRFSRKITPKCLFCHNNLTPTVDGTMAGYHQPMATGITCNRCHGDGRAHVEARLAGKMPEGPDTTIINPKHLSAEDQLGVCQQCHLQGISRVLHGGRWDQYSPGDSLASYMSIYLPAGADGPQFGIASQGYRLSLSRCATEGKATCTDCHSPHQPSSAEKYEASCLSCHSEKPCSDTRAHNTGCVDCHMYKGGTSDIPHVRFADHYIRRRPEAPVAVEATSADFVNALNPDAVDPDAQLRLALAHFQAWKEGADDYGDTHRDLALAQLANFLESEPASPRALAAYARGLFKAERIEESLDLFSRAVEVTPGDPQLLADAALAFQRMKDFSTAAAHLEAALKIRPKFRIALVNLANIRLQTGAYQEADRLYEQAEIIAPHLPIIKINRGRAAQARGNFKKARTLLDEAIKLDPQHAMAHLHRALLEYDHRRFREARKVLNRAIEILPRYGAFYWLRGRVALGERDDSAALRNFRRFLEVSPKQADAFLELGMQLARMERYDEAIDVLNQGKRKTDGADMFNQVLRIIHNRPKRPKFPEMNFEIND